MSSFKKGKLNAIPLKEVSLETNYALVISTNGGLWRYLIGDVVRFTTLNPFRIKIVGRTKSYINTFGEELIVENTDQALVETCKKHTTEIKNYTVAPIYIDTNSGGHQWLIEFSNPPKNLSLFTEDLDKKLKELNSDYEAKRTKDLILSPPKIIEIKNNEFFKWQKQNKRLGGQYKIPRLCNNRDLVEEILSIE